MRKSSLLALTLFLLALLPLVATAESTISCHCFKDRSFDHQNPEKVAPYLLATTQNSFLAVAFKTEKFQLVKALMSGVPSEHLWIANYLADRYGVSSTVLLQSRSEKGSWRDVMLAAGLAQDNLSAQLVAALEVDGADQQLAAAVVDETLLSRLSADAGQLQQLRTAGADNRETILAFFLAQRTGRAALDLYLSVQRGASNWGTLAYTNNVQIGKMEKEFKALL